MKVTKIQVGKIWAHKKTGCKVRIFDVRPAAEKQKYNFVFYTEVDVKEFTPSYRMALPEHSFIKKYERTGG